MHRARGNTGCAGLEGVQGWSQDFHLMTHEVMATSPVTPTHVK